MRARADDGTARFVADTAYSLAQDNFNAIHGIATGTNNCYSAYAVSQAYQQANYYNAQIERSTRAHAQYMENINRYLRGGR